MSDHDGRRWIIVGALFATLFLIWGPLNAGGLFFVPVVKHFGWSRGFFSLLFGVGPLAAGASSPVAGWLMDRIGARKVMIAGASMVALGYVALSRANSAFEFLLIFILLGVGVTASTIIPSALVITNWFQDKSRTRARDRIRGNAARRHRHNHLRKLRGAALWIPRGIRRDGRSNRLDRDSTHYRIVRTRPEAQAAGAISTAHHEPALPSLELREAIRSRSFWMIAIAELLFAAAGVGIRVHLIPYLTGIGYTPTLAAGLFAAMFIFSAFGSFAVGSLADSFGGRVMLTAVFVVASAGIAILLGAAHFAYVAMFIIVFGLVRETHLLPLVIGESLGVRRLGSILGLQALFTTIGFAAGPAIAGRIFDVTGSYSGAWILFMAMALVSALAMRATLPLAEESSRIAVERPAAA